MFDFFSGRRSPTFARRSMIATSHPLATAAGLAILADDGNAVDAALAALAVQCVVDPLMTGIGGDCFAIYAPASGGVKALNGSGRAPMAATIEALTARGIGAEIPQTSVHSVSIPGAVSAWCLLHAEHGSKPLEDIFASAISYAENGFPITPRVAMDWADNATLIGADEHAGAHFLPGDRPPVAGELFAEPLLGERLREIAAQGARGFYEGVTAERMVKHLRSLGGLHTVDDFSMACETAKWVDPISANYRGFDVYECPPNGQGLAALMILKIIEGFDMGSLSEADRIHVHAEATKIAYHHRDALIADPDHCVGVADRLLDDRTITKLRDRISMAQAGKPALWDEPEHRDTVYLCAVDEQGNAISLINSLFHGFGSTRYDPATGILFHSRGASFRMIEGHPNAIGPGKRPMHTIIPGMMLQNGRAVMPFGVMGGHYQAAGQAAFASAVIDRGLDLQAAMEEPRSFAFDGVLELEPGVSQATRSDLVDRGHILKIAKKPLGGSQAIRIHSDMSVLEGGSDSRKDGAAIGL